MADFNQAIVLGNLTRDPEMRYTANGHPVVNFGLATNRRWTNAQGQPQEEAEFHNIVAFGKLAEICSQILYKGRKALVAGRLRTRSWEGQDGTRRQTTEIIADNISALGAPRGAGEASLGAEPIPAEQGQGDKAAEKSEEAKISGEEKKSKDSKKGTKQSLGEEEINLDDIPF